MCTLIALAGLTPGGLAQLGVVDIYPGTQSLGSIQIGNSSSPAGFVRVGTKVLFAANDGVSGRELWSTTGVPGSTAQFKDVNAGWQASSPSNLRRIGNTAVFSGFDGSKTGLFITDGTPAGTLPAPGAEGLTVGAQNAPIAVIGSDVFIAAADGQLWRYDGNQLSVIPIPGATTPSNLTALGDDLYFSAGGRPFRLAPGSANAIEVPAAAGVGFSGSGAREFALVNGKVYFQATTALLGAEGFEFDPALNQTRMIGDLAPGSPSSSPVGFVGFAGQVYFLAKDAGQNMQLFMLDDSGSTLSASAKSACIGAPGSPRLVHSGGYLYFNAGWLVGTNVQLFAFNGSADQPSAFVVPSAGFSGSGTPPATGPTGMIDVHGKPVFAAIYNTTGVGNELCTVNLDAAGRPVSIALLADVEPAQFRSSNPGNLTLIDNVLYFSALRDSTPVYPGIGTELFMLPVQPPAPTTVVCCRGATCSVISAAACVAPTSGPVVGIAPSPASACGVSNSAASGCCAADFSKSDGVTVDDIFIYLNAWFAASPYASVGGDGLQPPTIDDIFVYLNVWFSGC
jgi:ELWxxDGT repeat protein